MLRSDTSAIPGSRRRYMLRMCCLFTDFPEAQCFTLVLLDAESGYFRFSRSYTVSG